MKIAILGSAPSSVRLAPYGDASWEIWGCSPGVYAVAPRVEVWFELHRWEPPVLGRADMQKPWFSPEYCAWMAQRPKVYMADKVPEIQGSIRLPQEELLRKYGSYFFTSSIAWMLAMAIESILAHRESNKNSPQQSNEKDHIGLWGVDMAANEEYADQRPGCQFFIQIAHQLGIEVTIPQESDLMAPPMLYGVGETSHMMIKLTARRGELEGRLNHCRASIANLSKEEAFLMGALDDLAYMQKTWVQRGESFASDFRGLFNSKHEAKVHKFREATGTD